VLIEALVVDYDLSKATELGVDVGARGSSDTTLGFGMPYGLIPGIDVTFHGEQINNTLKRIGTVDLFGKEISVANLGVLPKDFYISLKAMEERGIANIRSRPLLATINGHQASLSIGTTQYFILKTTIPYQGQNQILIQESQTFQTIEADVRLDIVPFVGTNGLMTVEIKPDFKTPVGQLSSEVPPTINRRTLSSTVVLKEGETIMLGGLVQEVESQVKTQVPILGSIPLLGALFSSSVTTERKVELIIYVTPHISYGESFQNVYVPSLDD